MRRVRSVGTDLVELWLDAPALASARPGQFVHVACGAGLLRRPFSLYAVRGGEAAILFRIVGVGTRALGRVAPGDPIDLLGPLGHGFTPPGPTDRLLLVGGGVGVPPLAFFAAAHRLGDRHQVLVGFRSADQVVGLEALGAAGAALTIYTDDGSRGRQGRVADGFDEACASLAPTRVLTCGPDAMMRAVAVAAARLGLPCEAAVERPMGCGLGVCLGCVVETTAGTYARACVEGPVFDAAEVRW